jgi:hypothetical protein
MRRFGTGLSGASIVSKQHWERFAPLSAKGESELHSQFEWAFECKAGSIIIDADLFALWITVLLDEDR